MIFELEYKYRIKPESDGDFMPQMRILFFWFNMNVISVPYDAALGVIQRHHRNRSKQKLIATEYISTK